MLKCFDVQCKKCEKISEQFIEQDEVLEKCDCGGEVEKIFTGKMTFELLYDPKKHMVGWAYDGYATTRYWDAMNKAKERGEKVMPATELTGISQRK